MAVQKFGMRSVAGTEKIAGLAQELGTPWTITGISHTLVWEVRTEFVKGYQRAMPDLILGRLDIDGRCLGISTGTSGA